MEEGVFFKAVIGHRQRRVCFELPAQAANSEASVFIAGETASEGLFCFDKPIHLWIYIFIYYECGYGCPSRTPSSAS